MAELLPHEQDLLARREQAVRLVEQGRTMAEAGAIVGLHRHTVSRAVRLHSSGGEESLVPRRAGRKPLLSDEQHAAMLAIVLAHRPDEVGGDGAVWTKAEAAALVQRELGITVGHSRAGMFLNRWGAERLRGRPPRAA